MKRRMQRFGIPIKSSVNTVVVAVGSGSIATASVLQTRLEIENQEIPPTISFLYMDADQIPSGVDPSMAVHLGNGQEDGVGTNPRNAQAFAQLFDSQMEVGLTNTLNSLLDGDIKARDALGRANLQVVVIGTCGGVGTYCTGRMVNQVILPVAKRRGVESVRIHVQLIGPGITTNASDRQVPIDFRRMLSANFAETMLEMFRQIAQFNGHDDERVFSLTVLDQLNNQVAAFGPMGDFERHFADCLFLRLFTEAGAYINSRYADHRGLGLFQGRTLTVQALRQLMQEELIDETQKETI